MGEPRTTVLFFSSFFFFTFSSYCRKAFTFESLLIRKGSLRVYVSMDKSIVTCVRRGNATG